MRWLAIVALALLAGCEMNRTETVLVHEIYNCEKTGWPVAMVIINRIPSTETTRAYNVYNVTCFAPR